MKILIKYSLLPLAFILMSATNPVSLELIMNRFQQAYDKKVVAMDINIEAIEATSKDKLVIEQSSVVITKESFYQKKEFSELFIDKSYEVRIDIKTKTITVDYSNDLKNKAIQNYSMDSVVSTMKKHLGANLVEKTTEYEINYSMDFYKVKYLIDKKNYALKQVNYDFEKGYAYNSMVIHYSNLAFDKDAKDKVKRLNDFISIKRNGARPSKRYSNYKIINRLK